METYVSLLRGINVGGNNKILMKDLKSLYKNLGFKEIVSYIQSGNVIFKSNKSVEDIKEVIEQEILTQFGLSISVIIKTPSSLKETLDNCTFPSNSAFDEKNMYFTFLSDTPKNLDKLKDSDYGNASFNSYKDIIYLYYPDGAGKTKLTNNFIERKLNLRATSRNLKTLLKLIELSF